MPNPRKSEPWMGSDAWGWAGGVGRTRLASQDVWQYFNSDRKCQLFYELDLTASSFSQVKGMNLHTSMSNEKTRLPSFGLIRCANHAGRGEYPDPLRLNFLPSVDAKTKLAAK